MGGRLNGIVSLDVDEFTNTFANTLPARNSVQIGARVAGLPLKPFSSPECLLLLQPAIGIGYRYTVKDLGHGLTGE